MKPWSVVRVAVPVSIGLGLVGLRPTWQSVAVLGLLVVMAMWLDGQERRADDVEDLEAEINHRIENLAGRLNEMDDKVSDIASVRELAANARQVAGNAHGILKEHAARLDAMAQQRKGPML